LATTPRPARRFPEVSPDALDVDRRFQVFTWLRGDEAPYDDRRLIIERLSVLVGRLANHMLERCRDVDVTSIATRAELPIGQVESPSTMASRAMRFAGGAGELKGLEGYVRNRFDPHRRD
jgi:hypothetical protein